MLACSGWQNANSEPKTRHWIINLMLVERMSSMEVLDARSMQYTLFVNVDLFV